MKNNNFNNLSLFFPPLPVEEFRGIQNFQLNFAKKNNSSELLAEQFPTGKVGNNTLNKFYKKEQRSDFSEF